MTRSPGSSVQVGYVITGMKNTRAARVGDTWHLYKRPVERLPGFKPVKSMVFAGLYQGNGCASLPVTSASLTEALGAALSACALCCFKAYRHVEGVTPVKFVRLVATAGLWLRIFSCVGDAHERCFLLLCSRLRNHQWC